MSKKNLVLRIIISPFIFCILVITYIHSMLKHFVKYIRWGGEWITYEKKDTESLKGIFEWLKDNY